MTIMSKRRKGKSMDDNEYLGDEDDTEGSGNESDSESLDNEETAETNNAKWVDSINKILKTNKPKGKKTLTLSKAIKLTDKKDKPKQLQYEIESKDGCIKNESIDKQDEEKFEITLRKKRKELPSFRVKPNILEKDRERVLTKIATKGVVQLFNAVKSQQKDIGNQLKEAGSLERKREKVFKNIDKRAFLDVLMGEKSQPVEDNVSKHNQEINKASNKNSSKATWNILRDDFMMDAKLKDWDKEMEHELEEET